MEDHNITFCRILLKNVMEDVRQLASAEQRKAAYVYNYCDGQWEFHGPDGYYWHGEADNAYHARAQGWMAWASRQESKSAS